MTTTPTNITCPSCGASIPLNDALTNDLRKHMQADLEQELKKKEMEFQKREEAFATREKNAEQEYERKLHEEKVKLWEKAQKAANEKLLTEMEDLRRENEDRKKSLEAMRSQELELRKQKREMEEREKNMTLEMERKMDEQRKQIAEIAQKTAQEEMQKKILEKDTQMEQMRKTIEELKRKSEQGSMQVQGDAQEINLKNILHNAFPIDTITDVPTGIRGGDVVQTVRNSFGQESGIILWESKSTQKWSNDWIPKLKDDRGRVKADVCILVSQTLPEGIEHFGMIEGIWVCGFSYALPLVSTLRHHLSELKKAQQSLVGKGEKMEFLYQYLTGSEFRGRIENIVSAFASMKTDLESERRSMERIWKKREKEIERVVLSTSGLYGDIQGIVGSSLPTVPSLELPEFTERDEEHEPDTLFSKDKE